VWLKALHGSSPTSQTAAAIRQRSTATSQAKLKTRLLSMIGASYLFVDARAGERMTVE
jgi:hypothetical protein